MQFNYGLLFPTTIFLFKALKFDILLKFNKWLEKSCSHQYDAVKSISCTILNKKGGFDGS